DNELLQNRECGSYVTASSGSGKTLAARIALTTLRESRVPAVYVNCWRHDTLHSILDKIVRDLGIAHAARIGTEFKIRTIARTLGKKPMIVVLDELDC
ncbi:MAG: AAA family ATPase, partial [Candidatus Bipolaricaulia bacterium]